MSNDIPVPHLVSGLYRAFLFREPDPIGLKLHAEVIGGGKPLEDVLRQLLKSQEFVAKSDRFLQEYIPDKFIEAKSGLQPLEFDHATHQWMGVPVTFALNKAASDTYTEELRRGITPQEFVPYIVRRAGQMSRPHRVADFGANVGAVSLLLAAAGADVLAVEAQPTNFMALATAARLNRPRKMLPVNVAAFGTSGLISLSGHSAWVTAGATRAGDHVTVACDTLVNILTTYGFADVDTIKIDIEGAELPALNGADALFSERPGIEVIYESNSHTCRLFGYDRQDLMRWFEERGFANYVFCHGEGLMPVKHSDPQPIIVADVLATKRTPDELLRQGETIVPMTDDYVLQGLLTSARSSNPNVRKHFVTEAGRTDDHIKASPVWAEIEEALHIGASV